MAKAKAKQTSEEVVEDGIEAAQAEPNASGRYYRIMHTGISGPVTSLPFVQGQVVPEESILFNEDVDLDRLLRLGAIQEADPSEATVEMQHPENQPFVDSTGRVVDAPGYDRPTIQHLVQTGQVKAQSAKERLQLVEGRRSDGDFEIDPAARHPDAIREQQKAQPNWRAGGPVPPEAAEAAAAGDLETADDLVQDAAIEVDQEPIVDPTTGEEIEEELRLPAAAAGKPRKVRR